MKLFMFSEELTIICAAVNLKRIWAYLQEKNKEKSESLFQEI